MITAAYLKRPVVNMKIRQAVVEAKAAAIETDGHGRAYITDYDDNNIMRLDVFMPGNNDLFPQGGVIVYGSESKQITSLVETAIDCKLADLI